MKINEVISVLKDLCVINGFTFIGNPNINNISDYLLHLKYTGTYKLANRFINVINKVLDAINFWQGTKDSSKNGSASSVIESLTVQQLPVNNVNLLSKQKQK